MFKKLLLLFILSAPVAADYTMIVGQEPGGGTSVWASIIAKHLQKHLGEDINLVHIPGARDIPGFNRFHNELRFDDKTIMVTHGANAESYLLEAVDYDYRLYEPIGGMNLTAVTAYQQGFDLDQDTIKFSTGSGFNPDMMAMILLAAGELDSINDYVKYYNQKAIFVKGMKSGARRLAFMRGELNVTRESTAAFLKHVQPMINRGEVKPWFNHGVYDLKTNRVIADPNFPEENFFNNVYKKRWGKEPAGPLYDAYLLVKQYRDVLQKAIWMNRGNPNANKVKQALVAMLNDPAAVADITTRAGNYRWLVGTDLSNSVSQLSKLVKEQPLKDLVYWYSQAFGLSVTYKHNLLTKQ
jgi:ribosomal protein S24E